MRRFLNVFLCFGLVVVFYGCGGSEVPPVSGTPTVPKANDVPGSAAKEAVVASVEIVYFGHST